MHQISTSAAQVVASDTRAAFTGFDNAILGSARLTVSMLEANGENPLPAGEAQKILQAVHEGQGQAIAGRAHIVSATRLLRHVKSRSNQAETGLGCAGDGPLKLMGTLSAPTPQRVG